MTVNGHDVDARYLEALLAQPSVSTIILSDGKPVAVKDIYVPRTLLHEVVQKQPARESGGGGGPGAKDVGPEGEITVKLPVDLWPKLRDARVVLVEGPAGMGKSTLTKQLVRESETQHLIPIWIPFRPFVASGLSLAEYLDQHYVPWLGLAGLRVLYRADETGPDRSIGQWLYEQWQSGLGVLILDGLDEVFRHEDRVAALRGLPIMGTGATRPATILTSRPLSQSLPLSMATVEVQGLTPSDQRQFIERYRASLRLTEEQVDHFTRDTTQQEQSRLQALLTRPGHLLQILATYATTNTLVETETAVLDQLLQSRLTITGRSQPPVEGDDAKKKRQVLESLALHLLACRQGQRQTRAQLLALIHQVLHEHQQAGRLLFPLSQATALLHDFTRNSGVLTEVEPEVYECETVIWLHHLTGAALANEQTLTALRLTAKHVLDFLDKKAWDPEWEPVLKSWVGHRENPFPLFTRLMDQQHDDLARHRLGVAGRCVSEVRPEPKSLAQYQAFATRIPTESFAVWKMYGKWQTEELVTESLGRAWVETEVGQTKLLALLQGPRSIMMRQAIKWLIFLQRIMPKVMWWWTDKVKDRDWAVRSNAAWALGELGPAMPVSVQQAMVARLADPDRDVRSAATRALGRLGAAMPASVQQALVAQLADQDWVVRWAVVEALGKLGAAMPVSVQQAMVARLADPDRSGRSEAVKALAVKALEGLGPAMPVSVQRALKVRLADENPVYLPWRLFPLGSYPLGSYMSPSVPTQLALVARLTDPDEAVRMAVAATFRKMGTKMSVPVQQALVARLADSSEAVREASVRTLRELEAAMPDPVQQALVARLADSSETVRRLAVEALRGLGAAMPAFAQQALVARLADPDEAVRANAAWALGELGPAMPVSVQQALTGRLADLDEAVRVAAGEALGELSTAMPVFVQQALAARLTDSDEAVCMAVAWAIGQPSTAMSVPVKPAMVARLADPDRDVRSEAVKALGGLGAAMPVSVQQAMVARLADPDRDVRSEAVKALGGLGTAMPVFVQQAMVARLADPEWTVRKYAGAILGGLGAAMPVPVQEALVARLTDQHENVRWAAAEALSSAQQQGIRLFLPNAVVGKGRPVSELSATAPFPDYCHQGFLHAAAASAPPVFSPLPLTCM